MDYTRMPMHRKATVEFDFVQLGKSVLTYILEFFESLGRAQAAHRLAQMGYMDEAKFLMLESEEKKDD